MSGSGVDGGSEGDADRSHGVDAAEPREAVVSRETTSGHEFEDDPVAPRSGSAATQEVDVERPPGNTTAEHRQGAERDAIRLASVEVFPPAGDDTPMGKALAAQARRRMQLTGRRLPKPPRPRILTVANQKGGVGKTTTAVNIAAALAQGGLRVLVVDLDPQGNASTALGIAHHQGVASIYDVLIAGRDLAEVVTSTAISGLDCVPSTIDLAGAEIELVAMVAREARLAKALASYVRPDTGAGSPYDYVFIDCPPSLGLLTVNAFVAAREVLIPIQCEYYALEGLSQLITTIDMIRTHLNPGLRLTSILLTMFDGRTRLSAQVADDVRAHFPAQTLNAAIPRSVRVSEAPSYGETVMTYDPASSGALAYLEAAGELADRADVVADQTSEGAG